MNRGVLGCLLVAALAFGCRSSAPKLKVVDQTSPARIAMRGFVNFFEYQVEHAADRILERSNDPAVDRMTVFWKMRAIPMAQSALLRKDDQAAAMSLWVISAAMVETLSGEFGAGFGDDQPIALEAAKKIEEHVRTLVGGTLTPEQFEQAESVVDDFVKTHVGSAGLVFSPKDARSWVKSMGSVLHKPLEVLQAPFTSFDLTGGLSDTAVAMHRLTEEVALARVDIGHLPAEVRWNAELLMLELDETLMISKLSKGVEAIGASSTSLAETAKNLPAELRTELTTLADSLEKNQAGLEAALKEANTTLENTEQTAQAINTMGDTLTETFGAFTEIVKSLESDPNAPPPPPTKPEEEGPPFDINDYGRTADKLTETANALTALFGEFEKVTNTAEAPPLLVETEASLRTLVNRLLLGGAGLVLFTALVAYGYRVAVSRRARG